MKSMVFKRIRRKPTLVVLAVLLLGALIWLLFLRSDPATAPSEADNPPEESAKIVPSQPDKPKFINLQPIVDEWVDQQTGTASVIIYDLNNDRPAASENPGQSYFAASLYKLFVAYEGYQKMASGDYEESQPYLGNYTVAKCLDEMIRSSYSPCAEMMWTELGKNNLTQKLKTYDINNTSMTGLTTTATDVTEILKRIKSGTNLTKEHRDLYLDSMQTQPDMYRRGLPSGFKQAAVYNKVGWNELIEWHDAAVVSFPGGRDYLVVVLTKNVGYKNVAALAAAIEEKVLAEN